MTRTTYDVIVIGGGGWAAPQLTMPPVKATLCCC